MHTLFCRLVEAYLWNFCQVAVPCSPGYCLISKWVRVRGQIANDSLVCVAWVCFTEVLTCAPYLHACVCLFMGFRVKTHVLQLLSFESLKRERCLKRCRRCLEKRCWKGRFCSLGRETEDRWGPSRSPVLEQWPLTSCAGFHPLGATWAAGGLLLLKQNLFCSL